MADDETTEDDDLDGADPADLDEIGADDIDEAVEDDIDVVDPELVVAETDDEDEDEDEEAAAPAKTKKKADGDEEDDDEPDPDDVEDDLDTILKDRIASGDDEDEDDEEDEVPKRTTEKVVEPGTKVPPRQPGEFVCASCFLVKPDAQLADAANNLCQDCV